MCSDKIVSLLMCHLFAMISSNEQEGRIIGGELASIASYPYSVYLSVSSVINRKVVGWMCGGSIVNQKIILSAGHCAEDCTRDCKIQVTVGHEDRYVGDDYIVEYFKLHEKYDTHKICNDISLLKLEGLLELGPKTSRVSLLTSTPMNEYASLAGWGIVDDDLKVPTDDLMHIKNLKVIDRKECQKILGNVPKGTICAAGEQKGPARGDSGSALTIRNYIQIGLVSFKVPHLSKSLTVYTEIAYYHEWIKLNAEMLFCKHLT